MRCPACGGDSPEGKRFCADCGGLLVAACSECGAPLEPGKRFCGDCGTPVPAASAVERSAAPADTAQPAPGASSLTTELRHVSVLFCDLVGFTPLSESKDPEDVRELLSGYFELARAIVARYGGIVEKFIGDAVMAVWGVPIAREDDAERAVRAGLELVSAVGAYGAEHATDLQARVGIVTGGAATTETAEEGLVIGDRVNTAARIQSVAPPGCCYVDETTRAATAAAIAYTDAGEHAVKGKAEPVRLFRAARVVATVAGSARSSGLEAGFIGRDRELRLVKELFHGTAERHSARLVLVSGVAGVGKSRLAWEFEKYIDGLAGTVLWHAGDAFPTETASATGRYRKWSGEGCRLRRRIRRTSPPSGSARASSVGSRIPPTGISSPPASASCWGCRPKRSSRGKSSSSVGGCSSSGCQSICRS